MRLSRADLVAPVLAIVVGAAIGGLVTLSPLVLWAPSDDVPAPDPVDAPSMTSEARADAIDRAERILRTRIDEFGVEEPHTERPNYIRMPNGQIVVALWSERLFRASENTAQPLIYIDGVRIRGGTSFLKTLGPDAIESPIDFLIGDAAVALYGEEASAGVILISLKEDRPGR